MITPVADPPASSASTSVWTPFKSSPWSQAMHRLTTEKPRGGVINAVTRAGTNRFHGSLYEFLRNSALDARNFFDGASVPPFKRNQFGGSLGGPIKRQRTFFFFDYEGIRQGLGVTTANTVPSPAARIGQLVEGPVTVSLLVAPFLTLFPLPNGPIKGDAGTYTFASQNVTAENF